MSATSRLTCSTCREGEDEAEGVLEIVSSAAEFEDLPIRQHEDVLLGRIYDRLPLKLDKLNLLSPYHKVFILLQAHFARLSLRWIWRRIKS